MKPLYEAVEHEGGVDLYAGGFFGVERQSLFILPLRLLPLADIFVWTDELPCLRDRHRDG